ncbi:MULTISPECIES: glycogen synthase [unclassified Mesotoga]|jgi:starch synthase|uniref:glycogen synthase n=1 Tax=unclassified Mesotoga TaxID=1184398 RepID=UPI000E804661|nr:MULTISPECIES: glycogen synthase [unclassified Mesotoga]MDD3460476.1 glycogen synthase [Mesotoga sp.]HAY98911.1 glycogen synthase [Mesotoga sp.]
MRVLFVSYEVYPLAKVGGLADVAGSLPKYLKQLGVDVDILMPLHGSIDRSVLSKTGRVQKTRFLRRPRFFDIYKTKLPQSEVSVFLLRNEDLMDSKEVYGSSDLALQAMSFSDAATSFAIEQGYDIVHLNDWHTGLMAVYLKQAEAGIKTVLSIHNLAYQGVYEDRYFELSGIKKAYQKDISVQEGLNFLKAGIEFSDKLSTVSPTYAKEIQTPEYGAGLEAILSRRNNDLVGILNGIDYSEYDPENDRRLWANFGLDNLKNKKINKCNLQKLVGLPGNNTAVIGLISRLVDQKGLDLIEEIKDDLMKLPVQLIVLGTGERRYELMFKELEEAYPDRVAAKLTFDLDLAQKIYGGADMFLMPSRYEPCGLGQMFAMRYGTIPVVRFTGGLADTVKEFDGLDSGNGFGFSDYKASGLLEAIDRALEVYSRPDCWRKVVYNAMSEDFSWNASAKNYISLYSEMLEVKGNA